MERYKEIIPEFEKFKQKIKTEQPHDIRINDIKASKKTVKNSLENEEIEFKEREWNEKFLKLDSNPSKTMAHWLGEFYIQESSSGIPPLALKPKPQDDIFDMCAAPGSKTTQISAMLKNKGNIIANDVNSNRIRGLLSNLYRLGCLNTQVTKKDARNFAEDHKFDKILLDAPCSGEGNVRNQEDLLEGAEQHEIDKISDLQEKLLEKAFRVCKSGGTIVYSTCTFAPEENELIVSKFLDKGELINPEFKFNHSPGITEWKDKSLDDELKKCVRVYPHQLDSGGIFVAKFKK